MAADPAEAIVDVNPIMEGTDKPITGIRIVQTCPPDPQSEPLRPIIGF